MGEHHHHTHHHHGHHHHHHEGSKNLSIAFFLNLSFTVIEFIGGLLTNSMAILSDALHDFGDSVALGLAWYFEKYSTKRPSPDFTYGYRRFSIMAAFFNSAILLGGSVLILIFAVPRLFNPQMPDALGMIYLAILGVLVNGAAVFKLRKGKGLNQRVVRLHLLEDVLGWVAVLLGAIIMMFYDLPIIDPILSVLIALYILWNVMKNLKSSLQIFLQAKPDFFESEKFKMEVSQMLGVDGVHDLHIWSMDGESGILTLHLKLSNGQNEHSVVKLKEAIREKARSFGVNHTTIEVEYPTENCGQPDCP
jgi:cobalt-zinc-cadmium efflux system protein